MQYAIHVFVVHHAHDEMESFVLARFQLSRDLRQPVNIVSRVTNRVRGTG